MHLGKVMHGSIDGAQEPVRFLLPARIVGRLLLRPHLIHVAVPAGIRLPPSAAREFFFDEAEFGEALKRFDSAIARLAKETTREPHPLIGKLTPAQWDKFHLRHCENHLGFVVPE